MQSLGAEVLESSTHLHLKASALKGAIMILPEASVTATENAVMAAVLAPGHTEIRWSAMEPHVQDLCHFLIKMGAKITGIGTPTISIEGGQALTGVTHSIIPDYLEAGTLALAAVLSNGTVTIEDCPISHLDSFFQKLEEVGAKFKAVDEKTMQILPHGQLQAIEKLQTSVYPGFATDLQAPFTVLLTQCEGESQVHETLFEGRLNYLHELERMGATVDLLNPHQALVTGPTALHAAPISSYDIRAGAAMVLAALVANGETTISDINSLDRGYEGLDEKLRSLGAKIERIQD
jgi:UDP-N-acetylglucosamine 1-carboxyvinyltransferase